MQQTGSRELRERAAGGDRVGVPVRGTQSFVHTMSWCWTHPAVTALEVMWRWVFGAGALALLWVSGARIFAAATGGTNDLAKLGLDHLTLTDPMGAATKLAQAAVLLGPMVWGVVRWMAPLLFVCWVVISSLGRTMVLRRVDPSLRARPLTLMVLQAVRVLALGGSFAVWFWMVVRAGAATVADPVTQGREPNLVLYFAVLIVGTLGLFVLWALVSWGLSVAPLLAMLRGTGVGESLRGAWRLGPLKMKLVEINLVMGIVKIALVVLAMVFSACPLPFQSVTTPEFLLWWTVGVGVLYLLGSDFFHVARMVAYLRLWRAYEPG